MASVNQVIIVGHLGHDPELRSFPTGERVANASIATTDRWKDKTTGAMKESTEWHRVVFNGRLAEIAGDYLRKGSQVYVQGGLRTRKWTDPKGIERYTTEIRADRLQMLGSRPSVATEAAATAPLADDPAGARRRAHPPSRRTPLLHPVANGAANPQDHDDIPF